MPANHDALIAVRLINTSILSMQFVAMPKLIIGHLPLPSIQNTQCSPGLQAGHWAYFGLPFADTPILILYIDGRKSSGGPRYVLVQLP